MMPRAQEDLSGWTTRQRPSREPVEGRLIRVEPFDIDLEDGHLGHEAGEGGAVGQGRG